MREGFQGLTFPMVGWGGDSRICISDEFAGELMMLIPELYFESSCLRGQVRSSKQQLTTDRCTRTQASTSERKTNHQ